jgi:citrate synthase
MTTELRRLLADRRTAADPLDTIATRRARGEVIPGFGHPLYPDGDPRAAALLSRVRLPLRAKRLIDAVHALTGMSPISIARFWFWRRHFGYRLGRPSASLP